MSDYTPTEDEIRKVWGIAVPRDRRPERDAAFDRMIVENNREVAVKTVRNAAQGFPDMTRDMVSRQQVVTWLEEYADSIEFGVSDD